MSEEHVMDGQDEFDALVEAATQGELLVDPQAGKYETAVLAEASFVDTERGGYLELKWSGLMDLDGNEFEKVDRVYLPTREEGGLDERQKRAVFIRKNQFNDKLKNLGVLPSSYAASKQGQLYFETETAKEKLLAAVRKHVGEQFPITIKTDDGGFTSITVRRRPRS